MFEVQGSQTKIGAVAAADAAGGQAGAMEGDGDGDAAGGEGAGVAEGLHGSKNVTSVWGSVVESGSTIGPGGTTTSANATLQYNDPASQGGVRGHGGVSQFIQIAVGDERDGTLLTVIGPEKEVPSTGHARRLTIIVISGIGDCTVFLVIQTGADVTGLAN